MQQQHEILKPTDINTTKYILFGFVRMNFVSSLEWRCMSHKNVDNRRPIYLSTISWNSTLARLQALMHHKFIDLKNTSICRRQKLHKIYDSCPPLDTIMLYYIVFMYNHAFKIDVHVLDLAMAAKLDPKGEHQHKVQYQQQGGHRVAPHASAPENCHIDSMHKKFRRCLP